MPDLLSELRSTYTAAIQAEARIFDSLMSAYVKRVRQAAADGEPSVVFEGPLLESDYESTGHEAPGFVDRVAAAFIKLGLTAETSRRSDGPNESTLILVVSGWAS